MSTGEVGQLIALWSKEFTGLYMYRTEPSALNWEKLLS